MTGAELARHLGVSTVTLWKWEQGSTTPSPRNLQVLFKLLSDSGLASVESLPPEFTPEQTSSLREVINSAKLMIAEAAGTEPNKVRISIDY